MRAVNLIPPEDRRGGGGAPGRSGGAVYALLGALAVMVIALAAYVLASNQIKDRRGEIAQVKSQKQVAQQEASSLRPYREFAQLRQTRVATVQSLATSRFDWDRVLRQLGRVLPNNVWLTTFTGTVSPGVNFGTGGNTGGSTNQIRAQLPVPAVELVGCTTSQAEVSRVMTRLRLMENVTRVSLASSEKVEGSSANTAAPVGPGANVGADCRHGNRKFPRFELVVFFKAMPGAATGVQPGAAGAAPQQPSQPGTPQNPAGPQSAPPTTGSTGNNNAQPQNPRETSQQRSNATGASG
jgi:Tfp pilus assembly protein PilN